MNEVEIPHPRRMLRPPGVRLSPKGPRTFSPRFLSSLRGAGCSRFPDGEGEVRRSEVAAPAGGNAARVPAGARNRSSVLISGLKEEPHDSHRAAPLLLYDGAPESDRALIKRDRPAPANRSAFSPPAAGAGVPLPDVARSQPRGCRCTGPAPAPEIRRTRRRRHALPQQVPLARQQGKAVGHPPTHGHQEGHGGWLVAPAGPEATGGTHTATTTGASAKRDRRRAAQTRWFCHLEITQRGRNRKTRCFKERRCNNEVFMASHLAAPAEIVSTGKDTDTGNLFLQPPQLCNAAFLNIE